jgi:hypothetical protein
MYGLIQYCLNYACAQGTEPVHPAEVYPLMIRCGDFFVGGASWRRHQQKFTNSQLSSFILMRYDRVREKERVLKEFFFYFRHIGPCKTPKASAMSCCACGEPILGPDEIKEEPAEEPPLDMENRRYNFYYRPNA